MKILTLLLMVFSLAAFAGDGHKHGKSDWAKELGLTDTQYEQMKQVKKANHKKMKAYEKELASDRDAQFAEILSADQMAQLKEMRKNHMAEKKHKKHKKNKKYKKEKAE